MLKCAIQERTKTFRQEQLQIHKLQHQLKCPLYNLDREGAIDRRKMIYQRTPQKEETKPHGLIEYNKHTQRWKCTRCNYKVKPQEKGNII